jgi:hypothetical protein
MSIFKRIRENYAIHEKYKEKALLMIDGGFFFW